MTMPRLRFAFFTTLAAATLALAACSAVPSSGSADAQAAGTKDSAASVAARNKQNAVAFYNQMFNQHDLTAADRFIGDTYTQHNPRVPDGREPFKNAFAQIFKQFPQRQSTIVKAIAEGDLVALHVHTRNDPSDRGVAIVDIFRFDASGKIVEHWDVIQPVPESTASGNTMF